MRVSPREVTPSSTGSPRNRRCRPPLRRAWATTVPELDSLLDLDVRHRFFVSCIRATDISSPQKRKSRRQVGTRAAYCGETVGRLWGTQALGDRAIRTMALHSTTYTRLRATSGNLGKRVYCGEMQTIGCQLCTEARKSPLVSDQVFHQAEYEWQSYGEESSLAWITTRSVRISRPAIRATLAKSVLHQPVVETAQ